MKPILFNTEMVRAILDGRKTCTRRVVKFPEGLTGSHAVGETGNPDNPLGLMWAGGIKRPPCQPGDILYIPETWKCSGTFGELGYEVEFQDGQHIKFQFEDRDRAKKWGKYRDKPSHQWQSPYFMPREAARLFLRVTDVRVERLQYCGYAQALDEGCSCGSQFARLWDSTIKKSDLPRYGWNANPWVWVIEFEKTSKEEAQKGEGYETI